VAGKRLGRESRDDGAHAGHTRDGKKAETTISTVAIRDTHFWCYRETAKFRKLVSRGVADVRCSGGTPTCEISIGAQRHEGPRIPVE